MYVRGPLLLAIARLPRATGGEETARSGAVNIESEGRAAAIA